MTDVTAAQLAALHKLSADDWLGRQRLEIREPTAIALEARGLVETRYIDPHHTLIRLTRMGAAAAREGSKP